MAGVEDRRGRRFGGAGTLIRKEVGRSRTGERERLRSLAGFRVLDTGREPEFDAIARLAARMGAAQGAVVTFLDGGREVVKASYGLSPPDAPRDLSFGGRLIDRAAPLLVEDALCDPLAAAYPWVTSEPCIRFYAGVPLTAGGLVVGTLALIDPVPRAASGELFDSLHDTAGVLMPHLERRREEAMAQNLIAVHDFHGRYVRVSAAFETVLGWTPADMIGRRILDFVHPEDVDRVRARLAVLRTGQASDAPFECRYRARDGGHRWLLWSSEVAAHEERVYSAGKDITDRKRNETALRESEARYRLLAENATDMIAGHDLNGVNTYVSSAGHALTGYHPDELIGQSAYALIHPDDHERLQTAHERLVVTGERQRLVVRLRRKDGTWVWIETIARLVRDERSRPTGIQSASRDVTEHKHAVEALEAAREHFRRAFDDAPIGVAIVDRRGYFERANAPLCDLLGYEEDELVGRRNPLELIHPEDRRGEEEGLRRLLRGECRTYALERRLVHKDGHAVWANITCSVMREGIGGIETEARLLAHVEDISDRRRNAEDLLRAREEAERANLAKSEFLSRMSHELRTPLNAVLGFAQLLDGDPDISAEQRDSVDRILRGGYHLLNLVNDVLDISAIESGRLPIPTEPVPSAAVVREAMDLMRGLADERSIRMRCDLPDDELVVNANAQRLKQVLLNLVANAIKYSPSGAEVAIKVERARKRALIHVCDTGPGIPDEQLERAFAPFERLGARRDVEGTGLGLPLSRNLVQAMSGRLTAVSGPGGSTFTVDLPLARDTARDAVAAFGDEVAPANNGNGHVRRVLYIEDNASNVDLLDRLVGSRGDLELHAANRGDAGIELARRIRPDVVVLDLHLPDTTGDAVLAQLRAAPATAGVPVIVVTADAAGEHEHRLLAAGATAYFTKPLDLSRFASDLDRALARAGAASR